MWEGYVGRFVWVQNIATSAVLGDHLTLNCGSNDNQSPWLAVRAKMIMRKDPRADLECSGCSRVHIRTLKN